MKALYPPGTETQVSIPDSAWHPTMRLDSRPVLSFGVGAGAVVDAPWDCMVLIPPGDVTAAIVVSAPAGTDFSSTTAPANHAVRVLSNLPSTITAGINRTYYCSSRTSVGASSEVVRYGKANPMGVSAFRTTYRGATLHNTSSALYNGGTLVAGQFAAGSMDSAVNFTTRDAQTLFGMAKSVNLPLTDDALTQMCPGAQAVDAKEGVFLPIRLVGPTQLFHSEESSVGSFVQQINQSSTATVICAQDNAGTNITSTSIPSWLNATRLGGGAVPTSFAFWVPTLNALSGKVDDTSFDNAAYGIVFLRNLPYQASFSLQCYVGIEAVLDETSPFRSLTMATASYDPRAVQAYYDIVAGMPFSYPASYNSLASILPYISSAIAALKPVVAPFLGAALRRGAAIINPRETSVPPRPPAPARAASMPRQPPARPQPPALSKRLRPPRARPKQVAGRRLPKKRRN